MNRLTATPDDAGQRLDVFAQAGTPALSRSRVKQLIESHHILLNSAPSRPSAKLHAGDEVTVEIPPLVTAEARPQDIPLDILHEDDDLIVINKPPGMVVHPGAGNPEGTLVNALLHHCKALSGIGGVERPGIVHRLDRDTSGCLVAAKNDIAHRSLSRQFEGREVEKTYLALADGNFRRAHVVVETAIARHPVHRQKMTVVADGRGRPAKTEFFVMERLPRATLVRCILHTGRTHQIRVHLQHLKHPVSGDRVYGRPGDWPRQMLHAWKLRFRHPTGDRLMDFESPIPADFVQAGVRL